MKQRQRVHQHHYARLSGKTSDESEEETELLIRKTGFQETTTVEKVVEQEDTLQALSIRYHCPIAELKRLNNIHRENEIFAKKTIKVPARPFSFGLASVHMSGSNSPKDDPVIDCVDIQMLQLRLNKELLVNPSNDNFDNVEINDIIFNSNVKPVTRTCDSMEATPIDEIYGNEEIRLLPVAHPVEDIVVSKLSCSDSDISWVTLIVCVVVVIVAAPLIYVFYIAEHPEQYHHTNS
ncbi:hypothetical protein FQA39_LY10764 [Lamprigera yunnana]|nr:hypothetical protein FQA39_LY10764 [Lamprigera yunnana]